MRYILSVDLADPELTYNKYNASTIESLFPSISFSDYFAGFSPRPTYPGDMVIVTSPDYLRAVASLLDREDDDVLEAYFVFKIAQAVRCSSLSLSLALSPLYISFPPSLSRAELLYQD